MTKPKYRSRKRVVNGETFDSGLEAQRWLQLQLMERAGQISALTRQVRFALKVGDVRIGHYIADFVYLIEPDGKRVIEDAKGFLTPFCAWKLKHMEAQGDTVTLWPERKRKTRGKKA